VLRARCLVRCSVLGYSYVVSCLAHRTGSEPIALRNQHYARRVRDSPGDLLRFGGRTGTCARGFDGHGRQRRFDEQLLLPRVARR